MTMFFSPAWLAVFKLGAGLVLILAGIRLRLGLAASILAASLFLGLASGLSPLSLGVIVATSLVQRDFTLMAGVVFLIMALARVQDASGQNRRLVDGMSRCIPWPWLRLVIFPALIGFLPMPGGALFSCPMLKAAAGTLPLGNKRLVLLNYWFRHIWELACPLYPGYILVTSLVGVPLFSIAARTFPLVFLSMLVGWFFFLRDLKELPADEARPVASGEPGRGAVAFLPVLKDMLPLLAVFAGMLVFSQVFNAIRPALPSQYAFIAALALAAVVALVQGKKHIQGSRVSLFLNTAVIRLLFLIFAIFAFKDIIAASDIVAALAGFDLGPYGLYFLFFLLPFVCGALMGVMVGYVGASVPILLSLIGQSGMRSHMAPLVVLALVAGNTGELLTPLHSCLAVTCEYFQVRLAEIWGKLFSAVCLQLVGSLAWVLALFLAGIAF